MIGKNIFARYQILSHCDDPPVCGYDAIFNYEIPLRRLAQRNDCFQYSAGVYLKLK